MIPSWIIEAKVGYKLVHFSNGESFEMREKHVFIDSSGRRNIVECDRIEDEMIFHLAVKLYAPEERSKAVLSKYGLHSKEALFDGQKHIPLDYSCDGKWIKFKNISHYEAKEITEKMGIPYGTKEYLIDAYWRVKTLTEQPFDESILHYKLLDGISVRAYLMHNKLPLKYESHYINTPILFMKQEGAILDCDYDYSKTSDNITSKGVRSWYDLNLYKKGVIVPELEIDKQLLWDMYISPNIDNRNIATTILKGLL